MTTANTARLEEELTIAEARTQEIVDAHARSASPVCAVEENPDWRWWRDHRDSLACCIADIRAAAR